MATERPGEQVGLIHRRLVASIPVRIFEISLVDPGIGAIFDSLNDGQCCVLSARISNIWIVVVNAWPKHRSAALWGHRQVQLWKVSATSLFDIVKIDWSRQKRQKG